MAHYAELGVDNIVKRVLYIDTIKCMTNGGIEKEELGVAYLQENHGGTWVKCSWNTSSNVHLQGGTPFRGNYPGVGWKYDEFLDGFIPPQPYRTWVVNETTGDWEPPVARPADDVTKGGNVVYKWNSVANNWENKGSPGTQP